MREKATEERSDIDQYGSRPLETTTKRLDLNDLLNRAKNQKKVDRKYNILIFFGAASVVVVFYLFLGL